MADLENILQAKEKDQWNLLTETAEDKGYQKLESKIYTKNDDYLMKMGKDILYFENLQPNEYQEVKDAVKIKSKNENYVVISYGLAISGGAIGGAFLGYLLIQMGLPAWTMVPAIITPTATSIYEILRHSMKLTEKEQESKEIFDKYSKNTLKNKEAIKKLLSSS
ncbi:MAG: hypothetical protein KKA79_09725 [Nanoarchaeota archaeon]|nr:hypothetical protein [Nanoarchaeota archaeon]MCG2718614.1 hypothetical protein [Nanoarchaeota archaeon]